MASISKVLGLMVSHVMPSLFGARDQTQSFLGKQSTSRTAYITASASSAIFFFQKALCSQSLPQIHYLTNPDLELLILLLFYLPRAGIAGAPPCLVQLCGLN